MLQGGVEAAPLQRVGCGWRAVGGGLAGHLQLPDCRSCFFPRAPPRLPQVCTQPPAIANGSRVLQLNFGDPRITQWNALTGTIAPALANLTGLSAGRRVLLPRAAPAAGCAVGAAAAVAAPRLLLPPPPPLAEALPLPPPPPSPLNLNELLLPAALRVLNLNDNNLYGSLPPSLDRLASLEQLLLGGNRLTGAVPPYLGTFAGLRYVALDNNQFTGESTHFSS